MTTTLSPEEYERYIRRNETWNFVVNLMDLTFFTLATSFIFGSTVLSLYASYLTASSALIGFIPAIQNAAYFFPQLLTARQAEMAPRKKPLVQKFSILERVPYLFIALSIFLWPDAPKWLAFGILLFGLTLATGGGGLAGPAWKGMLAKVIPATKRGLFFGLSTATGGLLGIVGARISRWVLAEYTYPTSFGLCFLFCFFAHIFSWICLSLNREPPKFPEKELPPPREYWRRLPEVLRRSPNFVRYLVSRIFLIFGSMGTAFYILYGRQRFHLPDTAAADFTTVSLISQTVCTPILGWLADRKGNKWLTELGAALVVGTLLAILFAPNVIWLYVAFALSSAALSGMSVAGMSITMEFSSPDEVPTFTALAGTILAVPILLAPVFGGWLADLAGYRVLFMVALGFMLVGWGLMHWLVREPRKEQGYAEKVHA